MRSSSRLRIALLGPSGFIGSEFARAIETRGHHLIAISRRECDIYEATSLTRHLDANAADFLINCVGYTGKPNVDACETNRAECLAANAVLPGRVASACRRLDLPWAHVSSGCIYTGRRPDGNGFTEEDRPNFSFRHDNCSFYSGSKALGEEVLQGEPRCYVWRLRIPFSHIDSARNYLSKLLRYDRLVDAENSISYLPEFIAAGLDCIEKRLPLGVYNLTNPGSVTTREIVELIHESGVSDKQFRFFESEADFMRIAALAPRSNCVLDSTKALETGLTLTEIRTAIRLALANWKWEAS